MKFFTIYNAGGEILRSGHCSPDDFDIQAQPGELIVEAQSDPGKDAVNPATGEIIKGGRPARPEPVLPYTELRRRAYPPIGDQLDMLWHAMNENVLPRVEPLYSQLLAVKQAHPKPQQP